MVKLDGGCNLDDSRVVQLGGIRQKEGLRGYIQGAALKLHVFHIAVGGMEVLRNSVSRNKCRSVHEIIPVSYTHLTSAVSTFKRPEGYFAGKLIQDAGRQGFSVGGAQVSMKHCGFVINKDNACLLYTSRCV